MVRKLLDWLYYVSGVLAALMMVGIGLTVIAQIAARIIGFPFDGIEISSYLLAGMAFMGLAYTWRNGKHLRITLLLDAVSAGNRVGMERASCFLALALCVFFTYYCTLFALESYQLGYKSRGLLAIPLWWPQTALALGLIVLLIAIIEDTIAVISGREPSYISDDSLPRE